MRFSRKYKGSLIALKSNLLREVSRSVHKKYGEEKTLVASEIRPNGEIMQFWFSGFKQERVIAVSQQVYDNSALISVSSLTEIVELNTKYRDLVILFPFDQIAYVRKVGKEVAFIVANFEQKGFHPVFGNYNFISGSFYPESDIEKKEEILRLLVYLFYGDITEKFIAPKTKVRKSSASISFISNDSSVGIYYADSLWKQRVNVSGFKVGGHFRLQPCGAGFAERKLIWIEDFQKKGYRRRATREISERITPPPISTPA